MISALRVVTVRRWAVRTVKEIADAVAVVVDGFLVGFVGEFDGFGKRGLAGLEEAVDGEGDLDFAEALEDGVLEVGEGFFFVGDADVAFGAEAAALVDGLGEIAGKAPDAEVAVEDFAQGLGGGADAAGHGEAGEEGALGFLNALAGGGEAAFGGEEVGTAEEKFGRKTGGGRGRDLGEFVEAGEIAFRVTAEEDLQLAGGAGDFFFPLSSSARALAVSDMASRSWAPVPPSSAWPSSKRSRMVSSVLEKTSTDLFARSTCWLASMRANHALETCAASEVWAAR